jgi:hypothetical protein
MPLHRELAKGSLEFGLVGGPFDFQGFVVAALGGGHQSNPPEVLFVPKQLKRKMQPKHLKNWA